MLLKIKSGNGTHFIPYDKITCILIEEHCKDDSTYLTITYGNDYLKLHFLKNHIYLKEKINLLLCHFEKKKCLYLDFDDEQNLVLEENPKKFLIENIFPQRIHYYLQRENIITLEDLTKCTKAILYKIPCIGNKSIVAIKKALSEYGLTLKNV